MRKGALFSGLLHVTVIVAAIVGEPNFDSPARQASPEVPEGVDETSWVPPDALVENTTWFWRAFAHDGPSAAVPRCRNVRSPCRPP